MRFSICKALSTMPKAEKTKKSVYTICTLVDEMTLASIFPHLKKKYLHKHLKRVVL